MVEDEAALSNELENSRALVEVFGFDYQLGFWISIEVHEYL
jgi:hypothetical protein